jgi:hypothetical protein
VADACSHVRDPIRIREVDACVMFSLLRTVRQGVFELDERAVTAALAEETARRAVKTPTWCMIKTTDVERPSTE